MNTLTPDYFHPDGRRKTYAERERERRAHEAANPPATRVEPIERPPVTRAQFDRLERAKREGKAMAQQPEPTIENPWLQELKAISGRPDRQHRVELYTRLANEWQENRDREIAEQARLDRIENDPNVKLARDLIGAMMKSANDDEQAQLVKLLAYCNESGDSKQTFAMLEPVEARRNARWEQERQQRSQRAQAAITDANEIGVRANESGALLEQIQAQLPPEPKPVEQRPRKVPTGVTLQTIPDEMIQKATTE